MIRVEHAPEPPDFDRRVRKAGHTWLEKGSAAARARLSLVERGPPRSDRLPGRDAQLGLHPHRSEDRESEAERRYDQDGNVVAHVDFKNHGKDPKDPTKMAVSGHGHTFSTPGDPSTGHGEGAVHHDPGTLPPSYSALPPGVQPHTPLGQ